MSIECSKSTRETKKSDSRGKERKRERERVSRKNLAAEKYITLKPLSLSLFFHTTLGESYPPFLGGKVQYLSEMCYIIREKERRCGTIFRYLFFIYTTRSDEFNFFFFFLNKIDIHVHITVGLSVYLFPGRNNLLT